MSSITDSQSILIYGSLTPGATPSASNLTTNTSGVELALNAADGKLFFKDVAGQVRLLADVRVAEAGAANANFTSGTINGVTIGGNAPAPATVTSLVATGTVTFNSLVGLLKSSGTTGVSAAVAGVDYVAPSSVGVANGVASLDSTGKVPVAQLPSAITGALYYAGTWNASTNSPTLASGVGAARTYYKVAVAGATVLDGITSWSVGDEVIFNGHTWEKVTGTIAPVLSVNGMTGAVTITRATLGAAKSGANSDITSLSALSTALSVAQGGTGRTTLTGLLKGNGTAGIVSAVAGTDYAVPTTGSAAQLLASNGSGGFSNVTIGTGLLYTAGTLSATMAGTGTVTSVNVAGGTTGLTFSGGPVTAAGTITLGGTLGVANGGTGAATQQGAINNLVGATTAGHFLRGNGSDAVMSPILASDVPTLNQNTTGSAYFVTRPEQPAITRVGTLTELAVAGSVTLSGELRANASAGNAGQVLVSNGPGQPVSWTTINVGTGNNGTVTSVGASGGTTGLTFSGGPVTAAGTLILDGTLAVAHGGTGTSASTGNGDLVLADSPVISNAQLVNGSANNLVIGNSVPATGTFTTATASHVAATTLSVSGEAAFASTGAVQIPVGTTSARPSASLGKIRYNSTTGVYEGAYDGGLWAPLAGLDKPAPLYQKKQVDYTAVAGDQLLVDTSGYPIKINLPALPSSGNWVRIADGKNFAVNKLILGHNGSTINNVGADLDITAGGVELTAVFDGITWRVFAMTYANTLPATGAGGPVLANSPTLVTPNLGTPSAIDLANAVNLSLSTGVAGTLTVANGGTGATTLTGLVKGNGTSALSAAVARVDYAAAPTGTAAQLLANDGGGGFSNVTVGTGLSLSGGVLTNTGGLGTVTSVNVAGGTSGLTFSGGPITTAGTLVVGGVLSPSNGGTGAVGLSGLVKGNGTSSMTSAVAGVDYAAAPTGTSAQLLANNGNGGFTNVTLGQGLFYSGGTLSSVSGIGTVTSVGASGGTTGLSFSGGPITGAGTVTLSGVLSAGHGGTGSTGITGLVKGNGTSAMTSAVAGVDYAPATTGTAAQLLANNGNGGFANITLGQGLDFSGSTLVLTGSGSSSGVSTFNGRQGDVTASAGDYAALQISAAATMFNTGSTVQAQLTSVGGALGASNVGYTQTGTGTAARAVAGRLNEELSVGNYVGFDNTGTTNALSAFANAYADAAPGQEILIPAGRYHGVSGVLTGIKHVVWRAYGYPTGSGEQVWDLPGTVVQYAASATPTQTLIVTKGTSTASGGYNVVRNALFVGGLTSTVNTAMRVAANVGVGVTTTEQALRVDLDNYAVAGDNAGIAVSGNKRNVGASTCATIVAADWTEESNPSATLTGTRITVLAKGTDGADTRAGLELLAGQITAGGTTEVGAAIRVGSVGGDSAAFFKNGIVLNGKFGGSMIQLNSVDGVAPVGVSIGGTVSVGVQIASTGTAGIRLSGINAVGIDLSAGTHSGSAIRVKSGEKVAFTASGNEYLAYSAGNGGLSYGVSGVTKQVLRDNGDVFMAGKLGFSSATAVAVTAGASANKYLIVTVDGNPYKLELLNV